MEITTDFLIQISIAVLTFSIIVIFASFVFLFFSNKKTEEEKKASSIFKKIEQLKKSSSLVIQKEGVELNKISSTKSGVDFNETDSSLTSLLIKKFKPKIESQLGSKVNIIEFNSIDNKLNSLIEISGVRILLFLDSSGKIIDYKKIKSD